MSKTMEELYQMALEQYKNLPKDSFAIIESCPVNELLTRSMIARMEVTKL